MVNSKENFSQGLLKGISVLLLIIVLVLVVDLFRQDVSKKAVNNDVKKEVASNKPTPAPTPSQKVDLSVSESDHIRGNFNAPVTIIEFSDAQCPFCQRFHDTMLKVMETYPNDVKWVYKHFPLDSIHPFARPAAEAAECAGDQGKFWEYVDELMANQSKFGESYFPALAETLNLDIVKFQDCIDTGKFADKVEADYQLGVASGVRGTPGNFINGQSLAGAVPFETVKAAIDALLK